MVEIILYSFINSKRESLVRFKLQGVYFKLDNVICSISIYDLFCDLAGGGIWALAVGDAGRDTGGQR